MSRRVPNCTRAKKPQPGVCKFCGCTEADCRECVEFTGEPCTWWIGDRTLCSACRSPEMREERQKLRKLLAEMENP